MKIISVVGPTQSGSTLIFNLLRFLYQKENTVSSCWVSEYKKGSFDPCDVLIVKCHGFQEILKNDSDEIFLPLRDLRDTAISRARRKGFKGINKPQFSFKWRLGKFVTYMHKNIQLFNIWKEYSTYTFHYEKFKRDEREGLKSIAAHLSIEVNDKIIDEILLKSKELHQSKKVVKSDDHTDPMYKKTLFTQSHNSSGGKSKKYQTFFSAQQNRRILKDQKVYEFLTEYNYDTSALKKH